MTQLKGFEAVSKVITEFSNWPPLAPSAFRRLWRQKAAKAFLRRMPRSISRAISRPNVYGTFRAGPRGTICIVSHSLAATGAPKVVMDLAVELIQAGYGLVVASPGDGPYRDMLVENGAAVVVDFDVMSALSPTMRLILSADAVVCNTIHCKNIVIAAAPAVPVMWYTHEAAFIAEMAQQEPAMQAILAAPSAVWAVSEMAAAYLRPFRPDVSVLIPGTEPLMDAALVPPLYPQAVVKLAVLATIEPRKGHDLLVSAIAVLTPAQRARLDIAVFGSIMEQDYATAWLTSIASLPNIHYGGSLAPHEIADRLVTMDGVIVPSRDEPYSLVVAECLSIGRIAMCTRRCGIAEYLTDGKDAFIAEDCTPEQLALMLTRALDQVERWPEIAAAGYRTYQAHFTRRHMTSKILAEIDRVRRPLARPLVDGQS